MCHPFGPQGCWNTRLLTGRVEVVGGSHQEGERLESGKQPGCAAAGTLAGEAEWVKGYVVNGQMAYTLSVPPPWKG